MPRKSLKLPKERKFTGPASLWKRGLAFMIDMLLIDFVVIFPFRGILSKIMPASVSYSQAYSYLIENPGFAKILSAITVAIGILALIYFSILEWKLNQTVGKILMNIYVVSVSKELRYWQALVRSLFIIPLFPLVLLWVIDPLVLAFSKTNQRLSEILSKTKTIQSYVMQ
jgi:hypothetical protein